MNNLHFTWTWIINWTTRMGKTYGHTVHDKRGKRWDWGQALCREIHGFDWMNSPEFRVIEEIPPEEPAPAFIIEAAKKWENGAIPEWVELQEVTS